MCCYDSISHWYIYICSMICLHVLFNDSVCHYVVFPVLLIRVISLILSIYFLVISPCFSFIYMLLIWSICSYCLHGALGWYLYTYYPHSLLMPTVCMLPCTFIHWWIYAYASMLIYTSILPCVLGWCFTCLLSMPTILIHLLPTLATNSLMCDFELISISS